MTATSLNPSLTISQQAALLLSPDRRRVRDFLPTLPQATRLINQAIRVYNAAEARGQTGPAMLDLRAALDRATAALLEVNFAIDAAADSLNERGYEVRWMPEPARGLTGFSEMGGFWFIGAAAAAFIGAVFAAPFLAACLAVAGVVATIGALTAAIGATLNPTNPDGTPRPSVVPAIASATAGIGTLAAIALGAWLLFRKRGAA